jgi:hypothetical protein
MNQQQFNSLKKEWYQKLKDSGFQDIEREVGGLQLFHGRKNRISEILNIPYEVRLAKEQYFTLLCQILSDEETTFKNKMDKKILELHCEGVKNVAIAKEVHYHTLTVGRIIKKYVKKWGIK